MVHLLPHPRPRIEAQANPHQPKHGRAHPTCLVCAAEHTSHGGNVTRCWHLQGRDRYLTDGNLCTAEGTAGCLQCSAGTLSRASASLTDTQQEQRQNVLPQTLLLLRSNRCLLCQCSSFSSCLCLFSSSCCWLCRCSSHCYGWLCRCSNSCCWPLCQCSSCMWHQLEHGCTTPGHQHM